MHITVICYVGRVVRAYKPFAQTLPKLNTPSSPNRLALLAAILTAAPPSNIARHWRAATGMIDRGKFQAGAQKEQLENDIAKCLEREPWRGEEDEEEEGDDADEEDEEEDEGGGETRSWQVRASAFSLR
eukprot:8751015-Pyramimonas_sp.AAC.1